MLRALTLHAKFVIDDTVVVFSQFDTLGVGLIDEHISLKEKERRLQENFA